jgi:hypothetical protein
MERRAESWRAGGPELGWEGARKARPGPGLPGEREAAQVALPEVTVRARSGAEGSRAGGRVCSGPCRASRRGRGEPVLGSRGACVCVCVCVGEECSARGVGGGFGERRLRGRRRAGGGEGLAGGAVWRSGPRPLRPRPRERRGGRLASAASSSCFAEALSAGRGGARR